MVLAPACKTVDPDPVGVDDIQFVSVNSVITALYDDWAKVTTTFKFRVKTFASTGFEGVAHVLDETKWIGGGQNNTGGQWSETPIAIKTQPDFGTIVFWIVGFDQ